MSTDEVFDTLNDVSSAVLLSLDEMVYKEEDNRQVPRVETLEAEEKDNVLTDLELKELKAYLGTAFQHISEQERLVLSLYYYEELTLKEIGDVMQISESRVSQIHTKAVMKLRNLIRENLGY
jgi:RNA polymerase sigma factor for flagellar operon FliA